MNFSGYNPHKVKKKKFPLSYFGRCDFDYHVNYPPAPKDVPGVAIPKPVHIHQWEDYSTTADGMIIQVPRRVHSFPGSPGRVYSGSWDVRFPIEAKQFLHPKDQFGLWWFIPWVIAPLTAGFLGAAGTFFWSRLKKANTEEERQSVKSEIWEKYKAGEISLEEYQALISYQDEDSFQQTLLGQIWKKYGLYIGGAFVLLVLLMIFRK